MTIDEAIHIVNEIGGGHDLWAYTGDGLLLYPGATTRRTEDLIRANRCFGEASFEERRQMNSNLTLDGADASTLSHDSSQLMQ
jgi:hypothetical protein